jgi:adenosine deaminase
MVSKMTESLHDNNTPDWFERVPKVELHLHLEGAIPYEVLWQLMEKYGGDAKVPDLEALRRRFVFRDFPHFIETWRWKNRFLREYEDFTLIAEAFARELVQQNIRYVEAFFAPGNFVPLGLSTAGLLEAVRRGLDGVKGTEVALIPDLVRDYGPDRAARTLAEVFEAREFGVIGIGIGGSEHKYPPELFEHVYETARQYGFYTSAHAGEAAGADSIWGAIRSLQVDRIGHGTRAAEDEALLDYLAEQRIPLEMCPLSNVRTGVIASIEQAPVRRYFQHGILVTINSDDPKMFGNSLAEEYRLLHQIQDFTHDEIRTLIAQGIEASWLAPERKRQMLQEFSADQDWT